ncbi:MAG: arylamine N-acetyltransferase family protein, partial [Acidimicrobiales bacterium]
MAELRDIDGYLRRIGLRGRPTWQAIHQAHATSIPFENLDPVAGIPVSLDVEALEDKLVRRRRGGYCFEHNLLLKAALESVGVDQIDLMLARVRQGRTAGPRPRSHLVLRVVADGSVWHADVGFGGDCLLEPIPFGPGPEVAQSGWRYRVVEDGPELVLQLWRDGGWAGLYGFVPEPPEPIDVEVANWYTCTN